MVIDNLKVGHASGEFLTEHSTYLSEPTFEFVKIYKFTLYFLGPNYCCLLSPQYTPSSIRGREREKQREREQLREREKKKQPRVREGNKEQGEGWNEQEAREK